MMKTTQGYLRSIYAAAFAVAGAYAAPYWRKTKAP